MGFVVVFRVAFERLLLVSQLADVGQDTLAARGLAILVRIFRGHLVVVAEVCI